MKRAESKGLNNPGDQLLSHVLLFLAFQSIHIDLFKHIFVYFFIFIFIFRKSIPESSHGTFRDVGIVRTMYVSKVIIFMPKLNDKLCFLVYSLKRFLFVVHLINL